MNKLGYIFLFFMVVTMVGGCQIQASNHHDKSSGANTTEERNVAKFDAVDLSISADVHLKQGSPQKVELVGDADDLAKVVTDVSGSELKIKTRPGTWRINHITVYITVENVKGLCISGSGSINGESDIKTGNLDLTVTGSGNISIPGLTAQNISSTISGSGNISYSGNSQAEKADLTVTGSGNIKSEGLEAKDVEVQITGSGDCSVFASNKLNVQITGSGSVYYKGKALINADVTGSGKVRQMQ